ncbi:DMT family transporter [Halegenticoccus soli]|uniref:DMT family transporter n=1 Tax=Halegenticoccus soli TaxID=1985678 RepID=UPI0018ECAE53|nr:DMT family transporter [Halegenticoccus soli]
MNARCRHFVLFVVAATLFGGTFVAARSGLSYFPPLLFVALRFDLAAAILLPYVLFTRDDWRPRTRRDVAGVFVTGVMALGVSNALLFIGQQYTTSGVASIVFSLAPVLTPVFAIALLTDERLSPRGAIGLLIGLIGVGIVIDPDPTGLLAADVRGRLILLCGAVSVALGSVLIRYVDAALPSTTEVAWGLPLGAATVHAASALAGESPATIDWTFTALVTLGYVGVFAGAVAYAVYFTLLAETGAIQTNLINYAIPIVATVFGWLLLGEAITATTLVGFGVIFVGFALLKYDVLRDLLSSTASHG